LLHTLAALLVVAIVRRLELPGACWGGAIFALHPVLRGGGRVDLRAEEPRFPECSISPPV